jgi:DNA (cytosine-5)-methyltransferase 1
MKISELRSPTFIDLFSGAGGLSEGFIREKFIPIAHVEMNKYACKTMRTRIAYHYLKSNGNFRKYISYLKGEISHEELLQEVPRKEIDSVIESEISSTTIKSIFNKIDLLRNRKEIDIVIGGPPCQAYSIVGRSRDANGMVDDPRNYLYKYYVKFLKRFNPKFFVFENVPGILSAKNGHHFSKIIESIQRAGYNLEYRILNAKDFGVLQDRKRVIIIGWRNDIQFNYPDFISEYKNLSIKRELFADLPGLNQGEGSDVTYYINEKTEYLKKSKIRNGLKFTTQHKARPTNDNDLQIYKIAIHNMLKEKKRLAYVDLPKELKKHKKEDIFSNRFQVINPESVSHTVVAHISADGHYYIFPDLKQIRSITIREAARIQSFPDDFYFEGGQTAAFKQIGNAVPPLMAKGIAREIKKYL